MVRPSSVLLVSLMLAPAIACAGWIDRSGNPLSDQENRKSTGDLGAWLILTDKEGEAFSNWNSPSEGVSIPSTRIIAKGRILSILIVFTGCAADERGNCNLVVKYKILQPDGSISANLPFQEAWVDKPVPPDKSLGISIGYVRLTIEENDPLGEYVVEARVVDRNSNRTLDLRSHFLAVDTGVAP